jgi:4'-phosphopantetheinyl transferase
MCDSRDGVYLYLLPVAPSLESHFMDRCRAVLSADEVCRADSFVFDHDRQLFVISHSFVRAVLSEHCDVRPSEWRFVVDEYGKPEVAAGLPSICFNLSHTKGLVACAVAFDHELGVDVENTDREVDLDIAERFFSPREAKYLEQSPDDRKGEVFLEIWTLKEAYIKACGNGLLIPLDSFTVMPNHSAPQICFAAGYFGEPSMWTFFQLRPSQDHQLAVCVKGPFEGPTRLMIRLAGDAFLDSISSVTVTRDRVNRAGSCQPLK